MTTAATPNRAPALEQNTLEINPASPYFNAELPASGAAVSVSAIKQNELFEFEREPFASCEEAEQIEAQVHQASRVIYALEELYDTLQGQDTLSQQHVQALQVATEHLLESVGFSDPTLPALEASELATAEQPQEVKTQPVSQGLREKIHRIWQAIIAALKKARLWLKDHLRRLFDSSEALVKYSVSLEKRLMAVYGHQPPKSAHPIDPHTFFGVQRNLQLEGKFPDVPELAQAVLKTSELITLQLSRFKSDSLYDGRFVENLSRHDITAARYDPDHEKRISGLTQEGEDGSWHTGAMLGGYRIAQKIFPAAQGADALTALMHTPHLEHVDEFHADSDARIGFMNDTGAMMLVHRARHLALVVQKFRELQTKLDRLVEELVQAAQKTLSNAEHDPEVVQEPRALQAQQKYLTAAPRMFVSEPARVVSYAITTAHWMLTYANLSVKLYERGTKPKEAAEAKTE